MKKNLFILFFLVCCSLSLMACASSSKEDSGDVQDIQPGQQSIIQPPAPSSQGQQPTLQERNI